MRTTNKEREILAEIEKLLTPGYLPPYVAGGHEVTHVKRMCAIAEKISDETVDLFLLKLAIWLHNFDRSEYDFGLEERGQDYLKRTFKKMLSRYPEITSEEINLIIDSVEKHNKLNEDSDSVLLRFLKDCDRLDMGAIGIMRLCAHQWNLPPYTISDFEKWPESTAEEHLRTMIHTLYRCLEWEKMIRIPKAKELARKRFAFMRKFLREVKRELKELDVLKPH